MNQVGLERLHQGIASLPAYCGFAFLFSFTNLDWEYQVSKNYGSLVSLFFSKLCIMPYQWSSNKDFDANEIPQLTVILPLTLH